MVTIGPASPTRTHAVARARSYAERHGYTFVQVTQPIAPGSGRTPHWEKVLVPRAFPEFDRYLIIDDDILINTRVAPALPDLSNGSLGMVKEPVPTRFDPPMDWLGNSGVLLFNRAAVDLLEAGYALGEYKDIVPGYGDQPALNAVAWRQGRVARLDDRWNYIAMADWLHAFHKQEYPWTNNRALAIAARLTFVVRLALARLGLAFGRSPKTGPMHRLRESYFVHLIWLRMAAGWVNRYLATE